MLFPGTKCLLLIKAHIYNCLFAWLYFLQNGKYHEIRYYVLDLSYLQQLQFVRSL